MHIHGGAWLWGLLVMQYLLTWFRGMVGLADSDSDCSRDAEAIYRLLLGSLVLGPHKLNWLFMVTSLIQNNEF